MQKSEQHTLRPIYEILRSFVSLVTYYHMTYLNYDNRPLKTTRQCCNGYVNCADISGELIYINFIHVGTSTIGIYPEYTHPENFLYQWPGRLQ